jgi:hypothetical protein
MPIRGTDPGIASWHFSDVTGILSVETPAHSIDVADQTPAPPIAEFNARAMQALGLDTTQMQQRGYLLKEPSETPERANPNKRDQAA